MVKFDLVYNLPIIIRVMALFSTSFFAKCLCVGEDGPRRGHLCHTDTLIFYGSPPKKKKKKKKKNLRIILKYSSIILYYGNIRVMVYNNKFIAYDLLMHNPSN